jgi:arylsulfatase A-like enzyme
VSIQPSSEQPNIILIIVDALTAEDMSLYGYSLPTTPNLERITNEWNVYLNAYTAETSSTGMLPTIMTGRYPYLSYPYGRYGNLIRNSSDWVSLFQLLSTAGYQTYWQGYKTPGFYHSGNGFHRFIQPSWKQAFWKSWFQFDSIVRKTYPYVPYSLKLLWALLDKLGTGYAFYETEWLGNMFENHEFQAPFFIYLHYSGAHGVPYQAGEFLGTFLPVSEGLTDKQSQSALYGKYPLERQAEVDKLRLRYDEAILNQDAKLDQLIQVIKDTGWYDSSMIIITADHGQVFNNGYSSHCTPLLSYAESHVPLLIKFPYQEEGRVLSSLVSSVDLAPTILDVCGIQNEKKWFDGLSLLGELPVDRYVFVRDSYSRARNFGLITSQYKFSLRNQDYYLYDYLKDPLEKHNLFSDQSIDRELVQRMTNEINVFISKIREQEYIF